MGGFAIFMLGLGLFTLQNEETTIAQWAAYQCVVALGAGVLLNSQLPAFQSDVREQDQATASATWGFIRSMSWVWGVAIPAAIFNNRVYELIHEISDPTAAKLIAVEERLAPRRRRMLNISHPVSRRKCVPSTQEPYRGSSRARGGIENKTLNPLTTSSTTTYNVHVPKLQRVPDRVNGRQPGIHVEMSISMSLGRVPI